MSALRPKAVIRDGITASPLLTLCGHSLDYGVQKVCVPKTRDLRSAHGLPLHLLSETVSTPTPWRGALLLPIRINQGLPRPRRKLADWYTLKKPFTIFGQICCRCSSALVIEGISA